MQARITQYALRITHLSSLLLASTVFAAASGTSTVNLPYRTNDNQGNQWLIYQTGQFHQQGNMPVYGQGAMLTINNAPPQQRGNQAKLDAKTGELIIENLQIAGLTLTRRILFSKDEGWVRYIDILKNTQTQAAVANITLNSNVNYGIQSASIVSDPKRKDQNLAWVAQTHANGRTVVEIYSGKAAKSPMTINYVQDNNAVTATIAPNIPAGKEVAIMHFHMTTTTIDAGSKFVIGMKDSKILASVPAAIRRLIINFRGGENFIGDYEILRGDILDVAELRSGDQLKGTLKETTFKLETFYGMVELPIDRVIGLINAGEVRPRQLVVTKDGEIFGGKLDRSQITLELSSGQVMDIPLNQVSRLGYRKRPGEPEEWVFDKPFILMRSGDRISLQMPAQEILAVTRYGTLKLKPDAVASIEFQSEDHRVHQIALTDGSQFAGLVNVEVFDMKLAGDGQAVKFPGSSVRRLQLGKVEEMAENQPVLTLANEDVLVGALTGAMKLDTAFSTIAMDAQQIKRLAHTGGAPTEVQVVLWDDTTVRGQLQEQEVTCQLKSGLTLKVPVALVQEYTQPRPQPSAAVIEIIKKLVNELSADDWKQRDQAQERLTLMGPPVITTLRQLRDQQSPEAQQRIDVIIKQLEKDPAKSAAGAAVPAPVEAQPMQIDLNGPLEMEQQAFPVFPQ